MKKSTKVLLVIFGILVFILIILLIIFRNEIFAETPVPNPQDKPKTTSETEGSNNPTEKPVSTGECQGAESSVPVDSGLTMWIECKTAEQVNAAPLTGDTYSMSFKYKFTFTKKCGEYILDPKMYWAVGSPIDFPELPNRLDADDGETITKEGTLTHQFKMGERYGYFYGLPIWGATITFDYAQEELQSNKCYIRRMVNPEETTGTEVVGSEDKSVTGGSNIEECKKTCGHESGCGWKYTDPICNGFCSMTCYIMELMAGAFNFAFGILHTAVGLS